MNLLIFTSLNLCSSSQAWPSEMEPRAASLPLCQLQEKWRIYQGQSLPLNKAMPSSGDTWLKDVLHDLLIK